MLKKTSKLLLSLSFIMAFAGTIRAEGWKEVFRQTEGQILDFAVASAIEPGYFRDMLGGRNAVGAQSPIVYLTPYLNMDWGYVTGYEEKTRGSLMIGGTIRVNTLLEDFFKDRVGLVRSTIPALDNNWSRLWVGPFAAHSFTDRELLLGIKAGLSF